MERIPIPSQTVGPFFHLGCTDEHSLANLAADGAKGERIRLVCRVFDGQGLPVDDAMIEIWQANAEGKYNHPADQQVKPVDPEFRGFGRMATDAGGGCAFTTVMPGPVPGEGSAVQAPHINVSVFARGILRRLAARIYFAGNPANQEDPVLALVPQHRCATLMAHRQVPPNQSASTDPAAPAGEWAFDIHLCGEKETVFFDV